ncbi:MAG: hypothetical protein HY616_04010 [Candidatus Rokubacteria bacterium]|nr:hypothetical protein [Candidatus Rokubacteria bacterium]
MTTKRIEDMDLSELLKQMESAPTPDSPTGGRIRTTIQVRIAEMQDASARALVVSTNQLGAATSRLVWGTWGLVGATAMLVVAEIIFKLLGRA